MWDCFKHEQSLMRKINNDSARLQKEGSVAFPTTHSVMTTGAVVDHVHTILRWIGVLATIAGAVLVLVVMDDDDEEETTETRPPPPPLRLVTAGLLLVQAVTAALDWLLLRSSSLPLAPPVRGGGGRVPVRSVSSSLTGIQQMGIGIVMAVFWRSPNGSSSWRNILGLVVFLVALLDEMLRLIGPYYFRVAAPEPTTTRSSGEFLFQERHNHDDTSNSRTTTRRPRNHPTTIIAEETTNNNHDEQNATADWTSPLLSGGENHPDHGGGNDEERGDSTVTDHHDPCAAAVAIAPVTERRAEDESPHDHHPSRGDESMEESLLLPPSPSSPSSQPPPRLPGLRRLLHLAQSQVTALYAGCAVLAIRLPCSLAMPHLVSEILTAIGIGDYDNAIHSICQLVMVGTIDAGLDFWGFFLFGYANQNIVMTLRTSLFRKLLGNEVAFFDRNESSQLASRLSGDCSEMAGDLTWFFRFSIESVIRIVGIAGYMLIRSPILAAACLSIVAPVAIINKYYGDWLRSNAVSVQDAVAQANAVAHEALCNIRTVLSFCGEAREVANYERSIQRQYELNIQQLFWTALYYMGT
jgi:ABC transporter transmembrane region